MMLSVALPSTAAQPAAHASLQFSSYPASEHTSANHVQNGYLWSNFPSLLDLTVAIEGQLPAF